MNRKQYAVVDLLRVMERLRDPQSGCPWDLQQDFRSIVPSTLEECYELAQSIEDGDPEHIAEELGDVFFQVVFYSQLGREEGWFDFESVVNGLVKKLIRRHPHVFAAGELEGREAVPVTLEEAQRNWELIKQGERKDKRESAEGLLADIPVALPALGRAQKLQKRAAEVNFDWANAPAVIDKVKEELAELSLAISEDDKNGIREEMGDLLFTCVNLARHLNVDAEKSLRDSNRKFQRRFQHMEAMAQEGGQSLENLDPQQLDLLWKRAKALGVEGL